MDPRLQTPTVLPSQGYSPPAPDPGAAVAVAPHDALQSQTHRVVEEEEVEDEYGSSNTSSNDLISVYEGVKSTTPQGNAVHRQPLQESTGNAQYQHHQHYSTQAAHYPLGAPYHLPSLPSTRSCTPIHSHHQQQHEFGGPLAPPPPSAATPPTGPVILQSHNHAQNSNSNSNSWRALQDYQHQLLKLEAQHHRRQTGRVPSPLRLRLDNFSSYPPSLSSSDNHQQLVAVRTTPTPTSLTRTNGGPLAMAQLHKHPLLTMLQMHRHPFFHTAEFKAYRLKQQKDKDKLTWDDDLEKAFLTALIIVPRIGRRKWPIKTKQHGRNMMISVYIYHVWRLGQEDPDAWPMQAPDELEVIKNPKKWPMFRKRKQVSSHAQVIKDFFKSNCAFHFFFVKGEEPGAKDKDKKKIAVPNRWYQNNTDQRNLSSHPVNIAFNEGRLPSVVPNWEYFRQLVDLNNHVQIRPSGCCFIYVANRNLRDQPSTGNSPESSQLRIKDETKPLGVGDGMKLEDVQHHGAALGYMSANPNPDTVINTYHSKAGLLFKSDYPHRYALNNPRHDSDPAKSNPWADREVHAPDIRQTLLHEYTFDLKQTESSTAREVLDEWAVDHPALHEQLQRVIADHDLLNAHMLPPGRMCDIIHVDVTLDIHRVRVLPEGTSLEWWFKISVDQERLRGHDWRVRSFLDRPEELARRKSGKVKDGMVMTQAENVMHFQVTHVRGCSDDNPQCTCQDRNRNSVGLVPTMADTWAEALDLCARFPRYLEPKKPGSNRVKKEEDMPESETVTQMDLMKTTAMFQELWSSSPVSPGSGEQRVWTRRAVICWTFNTIDFFDKENNHCETPAQTTWRFLSAIDPLSKEHLDRSYLHSSLSDILDPAPTYQQMLNAEVTDHMNTAWNPDPRYVHSTTASMSVSPMPSYATAPLSFSHGLVTPPASATLPSNYVFEGLPHVVPQHALPSQHMAFLSGPSEDNKTSFAAGDHFNADSYLQGTQYSSYYPEGDDNESDTTLQGDPSDLAGFDTQWPSINSSAHITNAAVPDWSHNGLHSLSMVAEEMAGHRDPKPDHLTPDVQHLPPYADFLAHLHTEPGPDARNEYVRHEEDRLRTNRDRRLRREARHQRELPGQHEHHDAWSTTANPASEQATESQSFSQDPSARLSQSTTGTWADDLSQIHHSQPLHDEDLAVSAPRVLQGYGTASLGPLLKRKRLLEEDDEEAHRIACPVPSYAARGAGRYAPVVDGENSHGWG